MRTIAIAVTVGTLGLACGGGGEPGVPLVSTTLTGEYAGRAFTPAFGFATTYMDRAVMGLGDGELHCGSAESNSPPSGTNVAFALEAFEVRTFSNILVNLYENVDEFSGVGSNSGTIELTSVTAGSIAGAISFDYTNDESEHFAINGSFEVARCAE